MRTDYESRNRRLELVGRFATGHRAQSSPNTEGALTRTAVRGESGLPRITWGRRTNRRAGDVVDRLVHESDGTVSHHHLHTTGVAAAGGDPHGTIVLQGGPTGVNSART